MAQDGGATATVYCCAADVEFPPPVFYLPANQLGARLGVPDMTAWRILIEQFVKQMGIISIRAKGEKWKKGNQPKATVFEWKLRMTPTPLFEWEAEDEDSCRS
jgi:hypothetical protein